MSQATQGLRIEPLWARVDKNRVKLVVFIGAFVIGSAFLLAFALVGVPGLLTGGVGVLMGDVDPLQFLRALGGYLSFAVSGLLLLGSIIAAVQLSNAEDWVRNRFSGGDLEPGKAPWLEGAVHDMSLAAGLPEAPRLLWLDTPSVNACAIGLFRARPALGFTRGFFEVFTEDEQRAVVATLIARITAGDILFGTALAALMGPLKLIRNAHKKPGALGEACGCMGDGCLAGDGCGDSCGCLSGSLDDADAMKGCASAGVFALFLALVALITWLAVVTAAWIVTIWGRALHRTGHEKADAEGMLLLKDPSPMLSALGKAIQSGNEVGDGDGSYDGIFYVSTSGTPVVEAVERRRYDRLREVLSTDGIAAPSVR